MSGADEKTYPIFLKNKNLNRRDHLVDQAETGKLY
jgi:hypothetical protein